MNKSANTFLQDRHLYEEAILRHVCLHCIDFGADGICHTKDPEGCAVFRYLPEFVAIAERLHEYKIQPYLDAVRKNICTKCRAKTPDGPCPYRDSLDCGLDRYLPLILEAIDEVREKKAELEWHQWRQL